MNIVILSDGIPPEGKGGAERIAWQSARMLSEAGHVVSVITTTREKLDHTKESVVESIRVYSIPSTYHMRWRAWICLYNPCVVSEVRRLLAVINPEIIHAHNVHEYLSYATLGVARACGARVFHTIHDAMPFTYGKLPIPIDLTNPVCEDHPNYTVSAWKQFREQRFRYNPIRNIVIRQALKNVDVLFSVSNALAEALSQNGIQNVHVLYNGISAEHWNVSPEAISHFIKEQSLEHKKILLFGGRITGMKGGDALLAALPAIVKKVPDAVLLIMGTENSYVQKLQTRADAEGIGSHIRVTGWITGDELRSAYRAADVVVVPSLYLDPLPTVVLEAMACGKPVVGSCMGGIPEMIQNAITGYTVHPCATSDFAIACIALLTNPQLAQQFGTAGAQRHKELFSEEHHLSQLLAAYSHKTK